MSSLAVDTISGNPDLSTDLSTTPEMIHGIDISANLLLSEIPQETSQVDNCDDHKGAPQQPVNVTDSLNIKVELINFTELRDSDEEEDPSQIHQGVVLPELWDACSSEQKQTKSEVISLDTSDIEIGISGSVPHATTDSSEEHRKPAGDEHSHTLDAPSLPAYESFKTLERSESIAPSEPERTSEDCASKDEQIHLLQELLLTVGELLSDAAHSGDFSLPDTLDQVSANSVLTAFSAMIATIKAGTGKSLTPQMPSPASQPAAATAAVEDSDWDEVNEAHPTPDYGLESPVISHLLSTWTTDTSKVLDLL